MGKLRIVKVNGAYKVEEKIQHFDQRESEWFDTWKKLKVFTTQTDAETFVKDYIEEQKESIPTIIKEYTF